MATGGEPEEGPEEELSLSFSEIYVGSPGSSDLGAAAPSGPQIRNLPSTATAEDTLLSGDSSETGSDEYPEADDPTDGDYNPLHDMAPRSTSTASVTRTDVEARTPAIILTNNSSTPLDPGDNPLITPINTAAYLLSIPSINPVNPTIEERAEDDDSDRW